MALKTVHVSPNLARPAAAGGYSFSSPSSPSYYRPIRLPPRPAAVLRCAANLHGRCTDDEVIQSKRKDDHQAAAEIPIVMCPSVTFPGATLQLQAFEFRYRIMMQTLLHHRQEEGGLIKFGVIYSGKNGRAMADVGCVVQVVQCERLIDDRFFLTCVAGDRFRVTEVVRTKPYVVARIQVLNNHDRLCSSDSESQRDDVAGSLLVQQVQHHLKNVAMLSQKLNLNLRGDHHHQHQAVVQLRSRLHSAASFSFLVARLFVEDPSEQQALLQMDDAAHRLAREGVYLERRSKYLAAIAAIKDAFRHLSCNEK